MKPILLPALFFLIFSPAFAQNLEGISKQKPFVLNGSIGASMNFYSSNEPVYTQPPYAWNLYGNFTGQLYGISLPASFVINQYGKSYSSPFSQFGISPTYKWVKAHLGYRNMPFSPLTFEGQSFKGAGIELTPGHLRFAAFYGQLNKAVNEDTSSGRFKMPQYSRKAYGVKLGVGNNSRYLDLIYFHAKDDSTRTSVINKSSNPRPQENTVLGTSFKVTIAKIFEWTGDAALSGLTQDLAFTPEDDSTSGLARTMGKLHPVNASTVAAWAGQTGLSLRFSRGVSTISYRRVQPDFKSLGTPYMLNDIEQVSLVNGWMLGKNKVSLGTHLAFQHNNLNKKLAAQLNTTSAGLNLTSFISQQFNISLNGTGYLMKQTDGTTVVKDSFRLNQQVFQLSLTPVYTINTYSFSGTAGLSKVEDKNPVSSQFNNSNNISASLTAGKMFTESSMNVSVTGLYNQFRQGVDTYTSVGATVSGAGQFLKNKSLSAQGSIGYLFNRYTAAPVNGNITFSANAGYRTGKHAFNLFTNYVITPPGATIITPEKLPQAVTTRNLAGGLSYAYSF